MNYTYLEKNWHIIQGDKTACGMDIPDDAETAAPQLAPQCPMCWVKDNGVSEVLKTALSEYYGEGFTIGDSLIDDPNTWGDLAHFSTYDADDPLLWSWIDYTRPEGDE